LQVVRTAVTALLALSLAAQIWYELHVFGREPFSFPYLYRIVLIFLFAALLFANGRFRLLARAARLWIAVDFAYSIADRFGLLGPYGSLGVSWGNWQNFVTYTRFLNGSLPVAAAPFLAVAATLYETALTVTLALGIYSRFSLMATSVLTAIYVVTMSVAGGFQSQFDFAVLLICTGSLFLAVASGFYDPATL
jgi:putative oxidoreductase